MDRFWFFMSWICWYLGDIFTCRRFSLGYCAGLRSLFSSFCYFFSINYSSSLLCIILRLLALLLYCFLALRLNLPSNILLNKLFIIIWRKLYFLYVVFGNNVLLFLFFNINLDCTIIRYLLLVNLWFFLFLPAINRYKRIKIGYSLFISFF